MKFRRIQTEESTEIKFQFNGTTITGRVGDSVASALLANECIVLGENLATRNPRAAFCMMGSCYECLVEINGVSMQACQVTLKEGMEIVSLEPLTEIDR